MVLLGLLLASTLMLINDYIDTIIDYKLRNQAFELARSNMEQLLSENLLSDKDEYGTDEFNPELDWETLVEPFYEPVTNQMWIRAVCSSGFLDSRGQRQDIELEHWITNLTPVQIKQIAAQQKAEKEFMDLLQGGALTDVQKATVAFLLEQGMDVEAYRKFLKQQLREKLEYIAEKGMDGYDPFLAQLDMDENQWLLQLGMDFDLYNQFVQTFDPATFNPESFLLNPKADRADLRTDDEPQDLADPTDMPETPGTEDASETPDTTLPADIPEEIRKLFPPGVLDG